MSLARQTRPIIGVGVLVWRGEQLLLGKRIMGRRIAGDTEAKAETQVDAQAGVQIEDHIETVWQFPGGRLEAEESVSACAAREVMEETGLSVSGFRHLGFTEKAFFIGEKQYMTLLVSCDYTAGEARVMESDKCAGWQWFDYRKLPDQMPGPVFEPIDIFMSQLADSSAGDLLALHRSSQVIVV